MRSLLFLIALTAFTACATQLLEPPPPVDDLAGPVARPDAATAPLQLIVSAQTLAVAEGASAGFDLSLVGDPNGALAVTIVSSDPASLPVSPSTYIFTMENRGQPVHLTVAAPIDDNDVSETAAITISAADLPSVAVAATVNEATQLLTYGWPTPFSSTASFTQGPVACYQMHVDAAATAGSFGVLFADATGYFSMALYADDAGKPGQLLADTPAPTPLVNGGNLVVAPPYPALVPGDHWLCLRVSGTSAVSASPDQTGPRCVRWQEIQLIDGAWPSSFGASTCTTEPLPNLFLTAHHQ